MARARSLKPGFFTNDELAQVQPLGRLLFAGLWCLADRSGRLEDRPVKIKAQLLPYDNCDCDGLLDSLAEYGFILRYQVGVDKYIQISKFDKHQNPHIKEADSTIPAPCENGAEHGNAGTSRADSLNPEPLTLNPLSVGARGFPEFWLAYPKKKSQGQALKAWTKIKPSEQLQAEILAAIERAKTSADWRKNGGQFIPYPATWLNAKAWLDEGVDAAEQTRNVIEEAERMAFGAK